MFFSIAAIDAGVNHHNYRLPCWLYQCNWLCW